MNRGTPSPAALLTLALARLLAGVVVIGALLFLPAGTLRWWQGWLWLAVLMVPITAMGVVLAWKDPALLERRMRTRETETSQKRIIAALILILIVAFMLPGFDRRYGWSDVPVALVVFSDLMILTGLALFTLTIRENRYASRVIEVQQGQAVISSGPYALIRHPMYLAMGLVLTFSSLALGSWWAFLLSLSIPVLLAFRIREEERLLRQGLPGYEEYSRRVRRRMIPFLW